jgi:hypothetical protein
MRPLFAWFFASASLVLCGSAHADDSFGTTPARPYTPAASPTVVETAEPAPFDRPPEAPLAKDPPPDWAVFHVGLRPQLGTFGGIATIALAHARTERFYGGFSLSLIRNDAGTHVGLAQIALGRNLADTSVGLVQLSLAENRARNFVGLGQLALAYNRALDVNGVAQIGAYNRVGSFGGLTQLGALNRADESFAGGLQIGAYNGTSERFAGVAQVGAMSQSRGKFAGLAQVGLLAATAEKFTGLLQAGVFAKATEATSAQVGGLAWVEKGEGLQLGLVTISEQSTDGAQLGIVNTAEQVRGVQIGIVNLAGRLRGLQIGLVNHAEDGVLPWTTLLNMGFGDDDEHDYARAARAHSARVEM